MTEPLDDYVFEVQITDEEGGAWRDVAHFKNMEGARREAARRIGETDARSVRIVEIREYDAKPPQNRP